MPILLSERQLTLDQHLLRFESLVEREDLSPSELNKLVKSQEALRRHAKETSIMMKGKNPLAHFDPSYLQALKLNCWMNGRDFLLDFESNRQGKTAVSVVRVNVMMCPPPAISPIFKPHREDNPITRDDEHFHQVLPPPAIALIVEPDADDPLLQMDPFLGHLHPTNLPIFLQAIAVSPLLKHIKADFDEFGIYRPTKDSEIHSSFLPTDPDNLKLDAILPNLHQIWHCSPDHKKFKAVCAKAWMKWTPPHWITSYQEHEGIIKISYPNKIRVEILSKSYDSSDDAFQGDAVRVILMTEGPPKSKWKEIKIRFEYPAIGGFDFTAAEPSNTNEAAGLAEKIYKKKEEVPMNPIVFSGFGIEFAPPHILPPKKKADLIRMYRNTPEGAARLDGKFFTTTPRALHALDKETHCKDMNFNEFVKAYYPNFQTDPSIKFRGFDEGKDSPSACVWAALFPDNVWAIYRAWQKSELTIAQRCKEIIALSGNIRKERIMPASGSRHHNSDKWYKEEKQSERVVMTIADYHIFKDDQVTGKTHARNYAQEGLILRASITAGPEQRVLLLNNLLTPPDGVFNEEKVKLRPRIVFLMSEPGVADMIDAFEEWYWDRYVQGPKKDEPKNKVSDSNDHLADALSYIVLSPFKWSPTLAASGYDRQWSSKPDKKYMEELQEFYDNYEQQRSA